MSAVTHKRPPSEAAFADTASRGQSPLYTAPALARHCPKRPAVMVLRDDPTVQVPDSCDAYSCGACGPRKVAQMEAIVTYSAVKAGAVRFITLTQAPETHAQRRQKMSNLRRSLGLRGFTWEFAWVAEVSDQGHLHIHAVQWGSAVPRRRVETTWGAGVHIKSVPLQEVARVVGYMGKGFRHDRSAALDLNGGRPLHTTRGYHHGLGKREVQREMRVNKITGELAVWDRVLVTA